MAMTTTAPGTNAVFADEHDTPIPYMQRTREYYLALGYGAYRWATSPTSRSRRCGHRSAGRESG
jgi:hypothetical protein